MAISKHRIFAIWANMKQRCFNKNNPDYHNYGGRGITICERWLKFENFKDDMFKTYFEGATIERENNNLGYSLDNCHWTDRQVQGNNKRNNRKFEFNGEYLTLPRIAELLNIKSSTLRQRYYVYKWDLNKCFKGGVLNWQ